MTGKGRKNYCYLHHIEFSSKEAYLHHIKELHMGMQVSEIEKEMRMNVG